MFTFLFFMMVCLPMMMVIWIADACKTPEQKKQAQHQARKRQKKEDKYDNEWGTIDFFDKR